MGSFYVNLNESVDIDDFDKKKNQMVEIRNKIVRTGAAYLEDLMFGNPSAPWYASTITYMHVGGSDYTNTGIAGPSAGSLPEDGTWQKASFEDFKLTEWIAASPLSFKREGSTVTVKAVFNDAQLFSGVTLTERLIRELGMFLGSTQPEANPLESSANMTKAMVARGVQFSITAIGEDNYYVDNPLPWEIDSGRNFEVFYKFRLQ